MPKPQDDLWKRVRRILAEHCENEGMVKQNSSTTKDLGLDSVALMDVITRVEAEFGVVIGGEEIAAGVLETPGRLLEFIQSR